MALTAIPVGFVGGLFGIGGGLITVPFLYYIFSSVGIDLQYLMHLAVGTSFAIIVPTSAVSVFTHHKYKAVDFDIVKSYGVFVIFGVILGTMFATSLKSLPLSIAISLHIIPNINENDHFNIYVLSSPVAAGSLVPASIHVVTAPEHDHGCHNAFPSEDGVYRRKLIFNWLSTNLKK